MSRNPGLQGAETRVAVWAVVVGASVLLFALVSDTVADPDLWGHLRFGLDILDTRRLPDVDPYSFTQDRRWINHEWLAELIMSLVWRLGGTPGLVALKATLATLSLYLIWRVLRGTAFEARFVVFAFAAASTTPLTRTMRPQLWTLLFVVIVCRVLGAAESRGRRWLPVVFAFWANLHGGWIVGLGMLATWLAADAVRSRSLNIRDVVLFAGCAASTLLTPYRSALWEFLAETVRPARAITEWQPVLSQPAYIVPWVLALALSAVLFRTGVRDRVPRLAVVAVLAYFSAAVLRIGPLFVACTTVLVAPACMAQWPGRQGAFVDRTTHEGKAAAIILIAMLALASWTATRTLSCISIPASLEIDWRAVQQLQAADQGKLVTFFNWGEYAIWHLGPRLRVSMDGRRETLYSERRLQQHAAILEGTAEGLATLADWNPEYVWLPAASATTRAWLVDRGYRIEHESARSFVAVRPDLPRLPAGRLTVASSGCFPG